MFKAYLWLTKPGIIVGNIITATGGFMLASRTDIDWWLLAATLSGTALIIASGCVFNNYIDRHIDGKMVRTKNRALAKGKISALHALSYATVLGSLGFLLLAAFTNALTVWVGVIGLFFYVVVYGFWKRRSTLGPVIGSVSGAMPILAGYVAVTGGIDAGAVLVFLILVLWQMPHFYAIAMYRFNDYAAAGLPVLPVRKGAERTKLYILLYIAAFIAAASLLTTYSYTGVTYLLIVSTFGFMWLWEGIKGFKAKDNALWARDMFRFSLRVILIFSIMISVDALLP
jgi:heme o synthase